MIAIVSLLSVLVLSLIVTRIGAVALRLTGMAEDAARFQARSALTGSGFTTSESEQVVTHPVRRRIVGWLMVMGNLGIVAASGTLIVSLVGIREDAEPYRLLILIAGLMVFYVLARSRFVDKVMCALITHLLRSTTDIETRDFSTLLHLRDDYRIAELLVEPEDWMAGRSIAELTSDAEGVLVLGIIHPDGRYEGAPPAHHVIHTGDRLVVYGLPSPVEDLDCRCNDEHEGAVA